MCRYLLSQPGNRGPAGAAGKCTAQEARARSPGPSSRHRPPEVTEQPLLGGPGAAARRPCRALGCGLRQLQCREVGRGGVEVGQLSRGARGWGTRGAGREEAKSVCPFPTQTWTLEGARRPQRGRVGVGRRAEGAGPSPWFPAGVTWATLLPQTSSWPWTLGCKACPRPGTPGSPGDSSSGSLPSGEPATWGHLGGGGDPSRSPGRAGAGDGGPERRLSPGRPSSPSCPPPAPSSCCCPGCPPSSGTPSPAPRCALPRAPAAQPRGALAPAGEWR